MSKDDKAIKQITEIARASGTNPMHLIQKALTVALKEEVVSNKRAMKQITRDVYVDQVDEINRIAEETGKKPALVLREALDRGLGIEWQEDAQ